MDDRDDCISMLDSSIYSQSTSRAQYVTSEQPKYRRLTDDILSKSCALDQTPVEHKKKKKSKKMSTLPIIWKGSKFPVIDKVPDTVRNVLLSAVMFSLIFYVLFVVFILVGAWVYHVNETEVEERTLKEYIALRSKVLVQLNHIKDVKVAAVARAVWAANGNLTNEMASQIAHLNTTDIESIRGGFREYLANLAILRKKNVGFDAHFGPDDKIPKRVWDYSGGLLHITGLISTVSYKPLRAQTNTSYTMNLLVVIAGIPLHLALLRNVGFLLSSCVTLGLRVGLPRLLRSRMYICCIEKLCYCKRRNKEEKDHSKSKTETTNATLTHGGLIRNDNPTVDQITPNIPSPPVRIKEKTSQSMMFEPSVIDINIQSESSAEKQLSTINPGHRNSFRTIGTAITVVLDLQPDDRNKGLDSQGNTFSRSVSMFSSMFRLPASLEQTKGESGHNLKAALKKINKKSHVPMFDHEVSPISIAPSCRSNKSHASAKSGKTQVERKKNKQVVKLMSDPFKTRQDATPSFEKYLEHFDQGVTNEKRASYTTALSRKRNQNVLFTAVNLKTKIKAKKRHVSDKSSLQGIPLHTYAGLVETKVTRLGKHGIVHAGQVLPTFIDMKTRFNLSVCRTPDCKLCEVESPENIFIKETLGLFSYRMTELCISLAFLPLYILGCAVYFQTTSRPELSFNEALYFCVSHLILLGSPTYTLPMDNNPMRFRAVAIITYLHIGLFLVAACFQPNPFPNSMLVFGSLRNKLQDLKPGFFVEYLRKQRKTDGNSKGTVYVESEFAKYDYSELPGMVAPTRKPGDTRKKT